MADGTGGSSLPGPGVPLCLLGPDQDIYQRENKRYTVPERESERDREIEIEIEREREKKRARERERERRRLALPGP